MTDDVGVAAAAYFVSRQQQQCVEIPTRDINNIKVNQRQKQKQQIQFQSEMTKTRW